MINYLWCVLGLLLGSSTAASGQISRFKVGDKVFVWAKSGMNVRLAPAATSAKVGALAYGSAATVVAVSNTPFSVSEKAGFSVSGYWVRVKSGTTEGFVFDGYLSTLKAPDRQKDGDLEHYLQTHIGEKGGKFDLVVQRADSEDRYQAADTTMMAPGDSWFSYKQKYNRQITYSYEIEESGGQYTWEMPNISWFEAYMLVITFFDEEGNEVGNLKAQSFDKKTQTLSLEPIEGGAGCYFTIKPAAKNKTTLIINGYCGC